MSTSSLDGVSRLLDGVPLTVFALDCGTGIVTLWNSHAERTFGWTRSERVGAPFPQRDVLDGRDLQDVVARARSGDNAVATQAMWISKDGAPVELSVWTDVQYDDSHPAGMLFVYATSLSHVRGLEEQLRQAQKLEALARLAGGLAHDLNNQLTVISGYGQMLQEALEKERRQDGDLMIRYAEQIMQGAHHGSAFIARLLAFSRRQRLQPQALNCNQLVATMEKLLRRLIGEDIELRTLLSRDLRAVLVDAGQLEQVIMNLVVNARDAMPGGGLLTIETANVRIDDADRHVSPENERVRSGDYVVVKVVDTGTGIEPSVMERLFEPFFTTKEVGKGTGLGLASVWGTVTQSGGYVSVSSEPGRGSEFRVYFPALDRLAEPRPQVDRPRESRSGSETLLLVEDEEAVRNVIRVGLTRSGYTVLAVSNPTEALRVADEAQDRIQLVLTDVVMPEMRGPELVGRLRRVLPKVKVLYMSGYGDAILAEAGGLAGAHAFLQKPFSVQSLDAKVREVLDTTDKVDAPRSAG